jgi:hypothetical protein
MEIIVMKSGAYRELMDKIDTIEQCVRAKKVQKPVGDDIWLDNDAVCAWLKISRRTLQRYRSTGTLAYSLIGRKTYYKAAEIKRLLEKKRVRRDGMAEVPAND